MVVVDQQQPAIQLHNKQQHQQQQPQQHQQQHGGVPHTEIQLQQALLEMVNSVQQGVVGAGEYNNTADATVNSILTTTTLAMTAATAGVTTMAHQPPSVTQTSSSVMGMSVPAVVPSISMNNKDINLITTGNGLALNLISNNRDYYPSPPSTETESSGSVIQPYSIQTLQRRNHLIEGQGGGPTLENTGRYPEYKH